MADADFTKRRFVCQGWRVYNDKPFVLLKELAANEAEARIYDRKKTTKHFNVGAIYEMEASETQIRPSTSKFEGLWPDLAERAQWKVLTDVADSQMAADKTENEKKKEVFKLLDPIRQLYWTTNSRGQAAIEVSVLNYLRRGKP